MMGDFASLAASSDALTVEEDVTLMAGIAKFFCCAYLKSLRTSSPLSNVSSRLLCRGQLETKDTYTMTPDFRDRTSVAPILNSDG